MIYRDGGKRVLDLIFGLVASLIFMLPILMAYSLIKITSPGPGFFFQTRVGKDGRPFTIYKLRTMSVDANRKLVQTGNQDPEVLAIGRVLRRLKIDELPQIFNIVSGDMSFVGPRPCLEVTSDEMPEWARKRFEVRPGITGLAQINGNVALPWEDRWKHDIHYADNVSFPLDFRICMRTFLIVALGEERFRKTI